MTWTLKIREINPQEEPTVLIDGEEFLPADRLDKLIGMFNGYSGQVTDPDDNIHTLSLEPWKDCDPTSTWVQIYFDGPRRDSSC